MSNTKTSSSGPKTAQDREIEKMLVDGEKRLFFALNCIGQFTGNHLRS